MHHNIFYVSVAKKQLFIAAMSLTVYENKNLGTELQVPVGVPIWRNSRANQLIDEYNDVDTYCIPGTRS